MKARGVKETEREREREREKLATWVKLSKF
jgi:hypothetical protein